VSQFTGELAALGTAICFAFGSILFTFSGRAIGAQRTNRSRLLLAALLVVGLHWLTFGYFFPQNADAGTIFWLGLSGFIGLVAGDTFLMQAFVNIGPRLSMLVMALAPAFGAVLAWLFLREELNSQEILGIGLAIIGVMAVVLDGQGQPATGAAKLTSREYRIGLLFALAGALGQAGGAVLSKFGLANDFPTLSATLIRLVIGAIILWGITALRGEVMDTFTTLRAQPRARLYLLGGTIMGPVLGIWLSLIAVQRTQVGIASALIALTPIFLIPLSFYVFKERVTLQAIIGTFIAVVGTVLLFV
jgi:drug/metabolite transporter (DMT)-like permease